MVKNLEKKELQVPSDLSEVQKTSSKVLDFLKRLRLGEGCLFDIRLCLEEALINAMKYGNHLQKNLKVHLTLEYSPSEVRIAIEDQGQGFDVKNVKDCTNEANILRGGGRGIYLIHQLMDEVSFNAKGNRLLMVKHLRRLHGSQSV